MIDKVLALLNPAIPTALAVKGLSKIDKRLGNYFTGAAAAGYGTNQLIEFLRNQLTSTGEKANRQHIQQRGTAANARPDEMAALQEVESSEAIPNALSTLATGIGGLAGGSLANRGPEQQDTMQQQPVDQNISESTGLPQKQERRSFPPADILGNYSKELADFINKRMQEGSPPYTAAEQARAMPRFNKFVEEIEKDMGQDFTDFVTALYGRKKSPARGSNQINPELAQIMNDIKNTMGNLTKR